MKLEDLVIGETYLSIDEEVIYCGINDDGFPSFELIDYEAHTTLSVKPPGWKSKGNNTYWAYQGMENHITKTKRAIRDNKLIELGL